MDPAPKRAAVVSIVIPALNEADMIGATLADLGELDREQIEIIVVDGGSTDRTVSIANLAADQVLASPGGRAIQMNRGAYQAEGDYLLFLHADTRIPADLLDILSRNFASQCVWGRFDVSLSGSDRLFRVIEFLINLRSRVSGIATGDQGIFVRRSIFCKLGGYPEIPLMEDIALSRKLRAIARPLCLRQRLVTSSRRWEQRGVIRTILLMWGLRFLFFVGVNPSILALWYR